MIICICSISIFIPDFPPSTDRPSHVWIYVTYSCGGIIFLFIVFVVTWITRKRLCLVKSISMTFCKVDSTYRESVQLNLSNIYFTQKDVNELKIIGKYILQSKIQRVSSSFYGNL